MQSQHRYKPGDRPSADAMNSLSSRIQSLDQSSPTRIAGSVTADVPPLSTQIKVKITGFNGASYLFREQRWDDNGVLVDLEGGMEGDGENWTLEEINGGVDVPIDTNVLAWLDEGNRYMFEFCCAMGGSGSG